MLSPLFTLKTATKVTLLMYLLQRCSPFAPRFTPRFAPRSIMLRSNPNRSFPSHRSSRLYSTSNSNSDSELPPTGPPINWYPGHISSAENQLEKVRNCKEQIDEPECVKSAAVSAEPPPCNSNSSLRSSARFARRRV